MGKRKIFNDYPTYVIIKDMIALLVVGKYVHDNPAYLIEEGKQAPYSCFWMFQKGFFKVPYDPKVYFKLFGLQFDELFRLYETKTSKEVRKLAEELFGDWTEEDNAKVFLNRHYS